MTKIETVPPNWTVRIWRQESSFMESLEDNYTMRQEVKDILRAGLENKSSVAYMLGRVLEIDRVNAVEMVDAKGNGEVLYKDWP